MSDLVIARGRTYRAKTPTPCSYGLTNDRQVLWTDGTMVQYDSPAIAHGGRYKKIPVDQFKRWAARDVTDELPPGDWAPYVKGIK